MRLAMLAVTGLAFASPALAQTASPYPEATAGSTRMCLARTTTGNPSGDAEYRLVADSTVAADLLARGFAERPCDGDDNSLGEGAVAICEDAMIADGSAAQAFRAIYGLTQMELCEIGERM